MSYQQPPQWGPQGYPPPGYPPQGYPPGYPPQTPPKKTSVVTILVGLIAATCFACIGFSAYQRATHPELFPQSNTPSSTQREYVTQSCAQVAHLFGNQSRMSDLQQNELWRQYDEKWVRWQVRVGEITETFGTLQMQFRCGSESLLFDGHAAFDDDQRSRLLTIQPGSTVQIEGRLADHGRVLGLSIRDATIASQ